MDFRLIWSHTNGLDLILNKIRMDQHINEKESSRNRNGLEVYFTKTNQNELQLIRNG